MKKLFIILCLSLLSTAAFAGRWVRANDGYIPNRAWAIGSDSNGAALYLCKADYQGSAMPGKLRNDFDGCHISYAGREIIKPNYRVFVGRHRGYWRRGQGGWVPVNAWQIGRDTNGAPLYLCRARYQGVQIGKVRPDIGGCNIAYGGREVIKRRYEVFVNDRW